MTKTAYLVANEDGTSERFIIETFAINKLVRAYHYACIPGTWTPVRELDSKTIAHKRNTEDTEMLFQMKARKDLHRVYGARVTIDHDRSTIF